MIMEAMRADITTLHVDAIVNAANSSLLGGGGVDGAIHKAAGPLLLEACRKIRLKQWPDGLPVGEAVATSGFRLPARWVIHTVGPNRHRGQTDPALLANAFRNSAECAARLGAQTIAFPAISGGVYGWDMHDVARIAVNTLHSWVPKNGVALPHKIIFALFSDEATQIFHNELERLPRK
ncbi:O-acetyl-ADP-ribose deacetylase [Actinotignum urinale]|nr:O-acetyl-ADP-ribose deacetylase [Actinotignum urinale]WIK59783.1 O-acetyl-ADP-ribose deacetylase [Actinotignum urinale]